MPLSVMWHPIFVFVFDTVAALQALDLLISCNTVGSEVRGDSENIGTIHYTVVGTPAHSAVTEMLPYVASVTRILPSKPAFFAISTNTARILTLQAIIVSEWYKVFY